MKNLINKFSNETCYKDIIISGNNSIILEKVISNKQRIKSKNITINFKDGTNRKIRNMTNLKNK